MTAAGDAGAADRLLLDELLGFRAQFSDRECDGSPLRIRTENGESEQTEANLRAVLWDAAQRIKAQAADLAATRADAEAKDRRIAELEEALEIALAEPCASCGIKATLPCPRSANASCFREFHGGSRAARTAGGSDGRS